MNWLSSFTLGLKTYLSQRKQLKAQQKLLNKPKRSLTRFKERYPKFNIGKNCYGTPIIKNLLTESNLEIGSYCSIAKNVHIFLGGNHRTDWISTYPFPAFFTEAQHIKQYETSRGNVTIGSDVWLCENCTILSGVNIGHGAVVANGAVVTKDVAAYEIVGGNPAKHIRWRFDELTREALLKSEWWYWPEDEVLSIIDIICSDDISRFINYANSRNTN